MDDQHVKGSLTKAKGQVEAAVGRVLGDPVEEALGHARQVQGEARQRVGDLQRAVRKDPARPR